jgi:hypothetical protein
MQWIREYLPETQTVAGKHAMDKGIPPETQTVAGKHTMDKGILPNSPAVAGEHSINKEVIPKTKLGQKDGAVRPKLAKPSKQTSDVNPQLRKSLRRSVRIASKSLGTEEIHAKDMPVGSAMGHGNPCDNALDEFNLTEKTRHFIRGYK